MVALAEPWPLKSEIRNPKSAIASCGYRFDPETGLYHARHRYYDPPLGRWMARDPVGYVGAENLYQYVGSTPAAMTDASGLLPTNLVERVIGALGPDFRLWLMAYGAAEHAIIGHPRPLHEYERCVLSLFFPDDAVLESARVEVGRPSILQESILLAGFVYLAQRWDNAVTLGSTMYFPWDPDTTTVKDMAWLAHEVRHVEQTMGVGGKDNFLTMYLGFFSFGYGYSRNPFEQDARLYEGCMLQLLTQHDLLRHALSSGDDASVCCTVDTYREELQAIASACLGTKTKTYRLSQVSLLSMPCVPPIILLSPVATIDLYADTWITHLGAYYPTGIDVPILIPLP